MSPPPPIDHSWALFVPSDSWTSTSSFSASSTSTTTGSDSYSTSTSLAASATTYLSSPMTSATASPTWRTQPRTSGQRSGVLISTPGGAQAIGSGASRSLMSSPVKTAFTPGRASAARRVDREHLGVRLGRAHDRGVQHARQGEVVDVGRAARDEARILLAAQRLADVLGGRDVDRRHTLILREASAAAWTALTMLW